MAWQLAAPVPSAWFSCPLGPKAEKLGQVPDSCIPKGRQSLSYGQGTTLRTGVRGGKQLHLTLWPSLRGPVLSCPVPLGVLPKAAGFLPSQECLTVTPSCPCRTLSLCSRSTWRSSLSGFSSRHCLSQRWCRREPAGSDCIVTAPCLIARLNILCCPPATSPLCLWHCGHSLGQ